MNQIGSNDIAWRKNDVAEVLQFAKDNFISVLGGDVIVNEKLGWRFTYDSWHCERRAKEGAKDFVSRSVELADKYVHGYFENGRDIAFVLVCGRRHPESRE